MKTEGHEDERGVLYWLDKHTMDFEHVTVGTINPGFKRGGHYHKKMSEKILCVSGTLILKLDETEITMNSGDIEDIPKNCVHTLYNNSTEPGFFIELKDSTFKSNTPDIHTRKK